MTESKSKHISFRVNEHEHGVVANLAAANGLSITDYARSCVLPGTPPMHAHVMSGGGTSASITPTPSSTPQTVYAALNHQHNAMESRLSTVESALQRAQIYIREEPNADSD